jgi:DNA-binding IclR family transcriptional regulator
MDAKDEHAALHELEQIAARAGLTPSSARRIVPSLEDVFISKLAV